MSPRKRAQRTFELLNLGVSEPLPWQPHGESPGTGLACNADVEICEDIREWDYGDYEGITTPEIRKIRAEKGLSSNWDIWKDGCAGGECVPPFPPLERHECLGAGVIDKTAGARKMSPSA